MLLSFSTIFRNRWCGAYMAEKGLQVIPTVNWSGPSSFDFCFEGIQKGSVVAVSTYMASEHGNHADQKDFFMAGYNEMLQRLEPEIILCYHEPFPEMGGNVIAVPHISNEWKLPTAKGRVDLNEKHGILVHKAGHVAGFWEQKGSGSAYGGQWIPKKEADERFLGKPGELKSTDIPTTRGGYRIETQIGEDGKALREWHYTDHGFPDKHSIPHEHEIDWSQGFPKLGPNINHWEGNAENKRYKGVKAMASFLNRDKFRELQFTSLSEFKWCLECGGEIEFVWKNKTYGVFPQLRKDANSPLQKVITQIYDDHTKENESWCDTAEEIFDYNMDGQRLRDVFDEILVTSRTI